MDWTIQRVMTTVAISAVMKTSWLSSMAEFVKVLSKVKLLSVLLLGM